MTRVAREVFLRRLTQRRWRVCLDDPVDIAPCDCGEINCLGWRLVPGRDLAMTRPAPGAAGGSPVDPPPAVDGACSRRAPQPMEDS